MSSIQQSIRSQMLPKVAFLSSPQTSLTIPVKAQNPEKISPPLTFNVGPVRFFQSSSVSPQLKTGQGVPSAINYGVSLLPDEKNERFFQKFTVIYRKKIKIILMNAYSPTMIQRMLYNY